MSHYVRLAKSEPSVSSNAHLRAAPAVDDEYVTSPDAFPCPNCATLLEPGVQACTACRLRLVGPEAVRLWQVNQQITALKAEADRLIGALMAPPGAVPATASYAGGPYPATPAGPARPARRQVSGQQILLGLGALLLLSAASFFLLVVWFVVGLAGQALIMATLTGAAVVGSVLATRKRLPAAAETAAVIATGLLTLDLAAAHWLDLAGLGDLATDAYWAGAGLLGGVLLIGFDRLVPRAAAGEPLRRILVFRPAGTAMLAVAGWSAMAAIDPRPLTLAAVALVLAVVSAAGAYAAYRLDTPFPGRTGWAVPLSAVPLLVSAGIAFATHVLTGLGLGYEPSSAISERYGAFALLLVVPAVALIALRQVDLVPAAAVGWLVPVIGIPVLDAPRLVLVGVSVVLAAALSSVAAGLVAVPPRPWARRSRSSRGPPSPCSSCSCSCCRRTARTPDGC